MISHRKKKAVLVELFESKGGEKRQKNNGERLKLGAMYLS